MFKHRWIGWHVTRWFLLPLSVGALGYGLMPLVRHAGPSVRAPSEIDLGIQEELRLVEREVEIANEGIRLLELSDFHRSCPSCLSFGVRDGAGGVAPLDHAILEPGQALTLVVRNAIHGGPSAPYKSFVTFHTNDPWNAEVSIHFSATVRGHLIALPAQFDLGSLDDTRAVVREVEIRDTGRGLPCRIDRIVSSHPELLRAELFRVGGSPHPSGDPAFGSAVGQFRFTVTPPDHSGGFEGALSVFEEGSVQPILMIPVRGSVRPAWEVTPSAIVLPRIVAGKLDYTATFLCQCRSGKLGSVDIEGLPSDLVVTPDPDSLASERRFRITWKAEGRTALSSKTWNIRLRATINGTARVVTIPVYLRNPE